MQQLEVSFSSTMSLLSSTLNCNSKNLCMPILRLVILIHSECNWYFRIIISYVESPGGYQWQGVTYACCMFVASVLGVLCMHHSFNMSYTTGMRIRTALSSAIYRKVSPSVAFYSFTIFIPRDDFTGVASFPNWLKILNCRWNCEPHVCWYTKTTGRPDVHPFCVVSILISAYRMLPCIRHL